MERFAKKNIRRIVVTAQDSLHGHGVTGLAPIAHTGGARGVGDSYSHTHVLYFVKHGEDYRDTQGLQYR